jgi:hypothetical protein
MYFIMSISPIGKNWEETAEAQSCAIQEAARHAADVVSGKKANPGGSDFQNILEMDPRNAADVSAIVIVGAPDNIDGRLALGFLGETIDTLDLDPEQAKWLAVGAVGQAIATAHLRDKIGE